LLLAKRLSDAAPAARIDLTVGGIAVGVIAVDGSLPQAQKEAF